jgi:inositol-phosphate transport system permease protein
MPSGTQQTLSTFVRSLVGEGRFVDYGLVTAIGLYYVFPILVLFSCAQDQLLKIYGGSGTTS